MGVNWTEDQKAAIEERGRGIVVSAAAGSGKTAVLIERIIRLLCDKKNRIPADTLLAVTFTNDAAAQMRDKLNAAIEKRISASPDDEWLLQQQDLVQLAKISTIDSFCLDLVKENLNMFDFQGGLKILEDAERENILKAGITQAMEELCRDSRETYELLDNSVGIENAENMVSRLYDFFRKICYRDRWIENAVHNYSSEERFAELEEFLFRNVKTGLESAYRILERIRFNYNYTASAGGCEYAVKKHFKAFEGNMSACEEYYSYVSLAADHRDWDRLGKLPAKKFGAMRKSGKMPEDVEAVIKDVGADSKRLFDSLYGCLSEISAPFRLSREHYRKNMLRSNEIFSALCKVEERAEEIAYETKLEKNAVDFGDIELMAKQLLVQETEDGFKRTGLAEEIRSSGMYRIIMIDEYQDVNDLQEIVFKAVSDTDDLDIMGKNTFLVGDVKQAIYSFRLTNPRLFKRCIRQAKEGGYGELLRHISLRKNFRSRREVLDLSNFIFRNIMSERCGEVEYTPEESLELGAEYTERSCPAEVLLVEQTDDFKTSHEGYSQELLAVSRRIRELIDSKAPVCENGKDRPCRPSDFCVLVIRNEDIRQMSRALETVGLKAFCEDTEGYIRSREISLALDMLRVVDNPMNDIALTAVMLSPIMGFSPDEAAAVRRKCRIQNSRELKHIYQILSSAARQEGESESYGRYEDMGDPVLQTKCAEAYRLVETLRYNAMSMSLERLVRRIFDVTDLMAITSLYLDSDRKRANLRLLLEYASSYEQNGKDGVTGFLRFIDSVSDNDKAFKNAVSVTSGADSVNVKTYHSSKGLEYPYVFLCCLDSNMLPEKQYEPKIMTHGELGYAFDFQDKRLNVKRENLYGRYLKNICDQEQKSEKMRLFYVGCTRAKEKLTLVLAFRKQNSSGYEKMREDLKNAVRDISGYERIPPEIIAAQPSVLYWVVMALAKHPDREPLENWLGMDLSFITADRSGENVPIEYKTAPYSPCGEDTAVNEEQSYPAADLNTVMRLRQKYAFEYNRERSRLPAKLTVTEIVQAEKEKMLGEKNPEFFPNLPRLNDELDKLTAAEKGTFTHKFMQLADYGRAQKSVREELNRLVEQGFFTPKEAQGVYVDRLESFVGSDFFKRMVSSPDLRREQKFLAAVRDLDLPDSLKDLTGGDGMIQGVADCIFREDGGWVLVDYKTDNFQSPEDMKKYGTQLALYKAAFELIYGERVKSSYIYSFKLGIGMEFQL